MLNGREYILRIDAFSPETLPMARLAEYMADLARLLGEEGAVHFVRLEPGSTQLVHRVESEVEPSVRDRIAKAQHGEGPAEAVKAIRSINRRLREDNGSGALLVIDGPTVIAFPGKNEPEDTFHATVSGPGSVDGVVVRLGGLQKWIPVHLETAPSNIVTVQAKRDVAKALAEHLWSRPVRVHGEGSWLRGLGGIWQLSKFYVVDFDVLDAAPLSEVLRDLSDVEGNGWSVIDDPLEELRRLRYDEAA